MVNSIMKNKYQFGAFFIFVIFIGCLFMFDCSSSSKMSKKWEEPVGENALIIGNVLVENINQSFGFENWGWPIQLVFLGMDEEGNIHKIETTTNDQGYFFIPNVPSGKFVLKEAVLPEFGSRPIKIVNDWDTPDSKFYQVRHPERPTDYTADWFPPQLETRLIDFNIMWFGLRAEQIANLSEKSIGEILFAQKKESLSSFRFYPNGIPYTRTNPQTYFKSKFPTSSWWK